MAGKPSSGSNSGRGARSASKFKAEIRRKRGQEQARDRIQEIADQRRGGVYRVDAEFAEADSYRALPPRGPERDALAEHVAESRAAGEAMLPIAVRLGFDASQISYLCKQYGITARRPS